LGLNEENLKHLYALEDFNKIFKLLLMYLNDCGFEIETNITGHACLDGLVYKTLISYFTVRVEGLCFKFNYAGVLNVKMESNERFSHLTHQYNLSYLDIFLEDHHSLEKFTKWLRFMIKEFK